MSRHEKFRCGKRNEMRLTPCADGEDRHGCVPGFCGAIPRAPISAAPSGSGKTYAFPNTHARDLSFDATAPNRGREAAFPTSEAPPPAPHWFPPKLKEPVVVEHVLPSDDGVQRSLFLPDNLHLELPQGRLTAFPEAGIAEWRSIEHVPKEPTLHLDLTARDDVHVTVTHDGIASPLEIAPDDDGALHVEAEMPPPLLLPSIDVVREPVDDDIAPPLTLDGFPDALMPPGPIDFTDPFGGLP